MQTEPCIGGTLKVRSFDAVLQSHEPLYESRTQLDYGGFLPSSVHYIEAFLGTGCEHEAAVDRTETVSRGELRGRRASENLMMVRG